MARIFSSSLDLGIFIWQNICFCLLDLLQKPQNWHLKGKSVLEDRRTTRAPVQANLQHLCRFQISDIHQSSTRICSTTSTWTCSTTCLSSWSVRRPRQWQVQALRKEGPKYSINSPTIKEMESTLGIYPDSPAPVLSPAPLRHYQVLQAQVVLLPHHHDVFLADLERDPEHWEEGAWAWWPQGSTIGRPPRSRLAASRSSWRGLTPRWRPCTTTLF